MAMSGGSDDGEPMMEMNTTPLIDVLLVLLIMFIITIPIQTHAVKVDLPQNQNPGDPNPVKNKIVIDATGKTFWNGSPVDDATLADYLEQTKLMNPEPELQFQPTPDARYETVDRVLAVVRRSGVGKLGFVGNEQYRNDF
ncbi:biopolymer transporter ExbD [Sphingomonas sp.]|uniref:ExbD/TolR family protein n=1 Tax=Sphingomonas sp. TaxID=28214 RepID=UPI001DDEF0C0|nr:biopolymer transporter ExbD [Sphingomonas sp.]MBX9796193.1 biopolymer transporter ExbD [Sphingomonas sp.]